MPTSEEAAAAAATTMVEEGNEAPETESGSEETVEEVEYPTFDIELPADLAALIDEEDPSDFEVTEDELDELSAEHEDTSREVLARMRAAEKRAEHLERLRVQEARKNWNEEAAKYFPLAEPFLEEITATSKRGYMRTAREVHEKMKPKFEQAVAQYKQANDQAKTKAEEEAKEEAKKQWGQAGPSHESPSEATTTLQSTRERRGKMELSDTIRGMIFPKE